MTVHSTRRILAALLLCNVSIAAPVASATLEVTVVDARNGQPLGGAFVMVGPGKGIPFTGNTAVTPPTGTVLFQNLALIGPQTVTAGGEGFAFTSVIESAEGSIRLPLTREIADSTVYGPSARVQGAVTGIRTVDNDGNLDIAVVLPALSVDQILGSGGTTWKIPPDTLEIPGYGPIVLPGNIFIPLQRELFVLDIEKPLYKLDFPAQTVQTLHSISARIPLSLILDPPEDLGVLLQIAQVRELGVERDRAVLNGATIHFASDLDDRRNVTVTIEGAPSGTTFTAASLASIPVAGGEGVLGYDIRYALVDTTDSFELASWVPAVDIPDAQNFVGGGYADSSIYRAFSAGRIDRTPFSPPATRVIRDMYDPPVLTRQRAVFNWNDVHDPGVEPPATWIAHTIRLSAITPGDSTVQEHLLWRIIAEAGAHSFSLPSLPGEAPGPPAGLIDPASTPDADRLVWDAFAGNPQGTIDEILVTPFRGVTHFSTRSLTLDLRPADILEPIEEASLGIEPNPFTREVRIRLGEAGAAGRRIEVFDPTGRRIRSIGLASGQSGAVWDGRDDMGRSAPPGIYLVRAGTGESGKLLKLR